MEHCNSTTQENELIELFRRCPRCSRSLRPLVLDTFTDDEGGQQYERIWWTCPGIEQKECFFPLDIPKEVFWTRRSMDQSLRGILPLPNLHLLPHSLRALYQKLFDSSIDIEQIVRLSAFVPPEGQKNVTQNANFGAEEQPKQQESAHIGQFSVASAGPSLSNNFSSHFHSSRTAFCDALPSSSKRIDDQRTVHSYLKETLRNQLRHGETASVRGDHRKSVDLSSNANAALNYHILLNGTRDPKWMVNSLNSLDLAARKKPSVPRYYSQQQHIRLQGILRNATLKRNGIGRGKPTGGKTPHDGQRTPRYLFARTVLNGEESPKKKKAGNQPKEAVEKSDKGTKADGKGRSQRNNGLDVFAALDTLQKSMVTKDLMSRFYGQQRSPSATPSGEVTPTHPTEPNQRMDSSDTFRGVNAFLPQSPSVGPRSTGTHLTNSAGSSESDSSSMGRFRRGLSIGPAFAGVSDNVEDPSLAEKITRNYESIFLKTLEQMNTSRRRSATPSALSPHRFRSPASLPFVSHEAHFAEEGTLGGIPHDFHFPSLHSPVRPSNQLTPINYAEGENPSTRFAHTEMEVTELSQQQQLMPTFSLREMTDYDNYLGFGLEEEGDSADLGMAPMMPAGEADDERDFLRSQLGLIP